MDRVVDGVCVAPGPAGATNAATNSAALAYRCCGSFSSAWTTARSVATGTSGRRRLRHLLRHHGARVGALKWRLAREHLVHDACEAVDVARRAKLRLATRLLRTHVCRRPDRDADFGDDLAAPVFSAVAGAGDAEVGKDGVTVREQNVLRLHIAMHESFAMREVEAGADLLCDSERLLQRQQARLLESVAQRAARDVWLDVVEESSGFAGVDQGNDVGMGETRRDADLPQKSFGTQRRGDLGAQYFDRDFTAVFFLFGEIDRRHAAAPEFALDGVAIGECGNYRRGGTLLSGHGAKS